ncbi:hypothetical protein B0H12DRAFT_32562 [Mycena haematopus]|nr:hypothetical protein B0H12DRAFT_32562 [Mycena haematopus]
MFNRSDSPSTPLSLTSPKTSKKRRRESLDCTELSARESGKPKVPRRIDPDRLAIRLGPELVSEMDAYIVPGAKMPSFEIRQSFVTRYAVDRRHIYDYFHSRGLRVAKEDKHLNLSHRMSRKPVAARKPAASKAVSLDPVKPVESAIFDSSPSETNPAPPLTVVAESTESSMDSATTISYPSSSETIPILSSTVPTKSTKGSSKRRIPRSSRPSPASVSPLLPSLQSMALSSDSSSDEDGSSPIFDFTDTLTESSSLDEDLNLLSLGHLVSNDKLRESFGFDFIPFPYASPDDLLYELDELQRDIPVCDSLLPLDGLSSLSENDRMEFYNLVNAGIGPAQGIEECAGTYKAHMERLYFNRSYPGAEPQSRYHDDPFCSTTPEIVYSPHPPSTIEKENVDPQLSTSHAVINSQSYYRQCAFPPSPLRRHVSHYTPLSPQSEQPPAPSTSHPKPFALLPSVSNQEKITSSTPPTDPKPHGPSTPLIWMSPVKYSASASSQLRTQQWQAQMSQVLARSDPFAKPTFYTQSGDRITYRPKSTMAQS